MFISDSKNPTYKIDFFLYHWIFQRHCSLPIHMSDSGAIYCGGHPFPIPN